LSKKLLVMVGLTIILASVSLYSLFNVKASTPPVKHAIILKEAESPKGHLLIYVEGDTEYLEDVKSRQVTPLSKVTGQELQAMSRVEGYPIASYSYMFESKLVDPISLKIGIEQSIPYTYTSTPAQSSIYIETLLYDGWEIAATYRDKEYVDYYLMKDKVYGRVILLENSIKIFYETKGNFPDPQTYISERKDGQ
jgi:hypothetical protein